MSHMYKDVIYFFIKKELLKLFKVRVYAIKNNLNLNFCCSIKEFINKYNKQTIVVYNKEEKEQIDEINKLFYFASIKFVEVEELGENYQKTTNDNGMILTKNQISVFFDHIHMFAIDPSSVFLKRVLYNSIKYSNSFNYNVLLITCIQLGLNLKKEQFAIRKYIKDWRIKESKYLLNFLPYYNFSKITIKNFINDAICHIKLMPKISDNYKYYNCKYYLKAIYGERLSVVKNNTFYNELQNKLKVKI